MKMLLAELRLLLAVEVITEAGDVLALAARGAKNRAIVVCDALDSSSGSSEQSEMIVCDAEGRSVASAQPGDDIEGEDGETWTQLQRLHADTPFDAVLVLYAALVTWKRVIPDIQTSVAAQAVIRRYWLANKDDPTRVVNDVLDTDSAGLVTLDGASADDGYMRAGYLAPSDGPDISAALRRGEKMSERNPVAVQTNLRDESRKGFDNAYRDVRRTKADKARYASAPADESNVFDRTYRSLYDIAGAGKHDRHNTDVALMHLSDFIDHAEPDQVEAIETWVGDNVPNWSAPTGMKLIASANAWEMFERSILKRCHVAADKALDSLDDAIARSQRVHA